MISAIGNNVAEHLRAFEQMEAGMNNITMLDTIHKGELPVAEVKLSNEDILVTHNIREMQKLMNDYVGIVRSDFRRERAMRRLGLLYEETEAFYKQTKLSVKLCELRNLIQVSYIVVKSAMMRKESRGLHYTTDYPEHAAELKDTVF